MPARPLAEWLTVLLWDLEGLKGKIIAPNMGKKNWLIDHIYCVFFCTGCGVCGGIYYEGIYMVKVILTEIYMLEHFL